MSSPPAGRGALERIVQRTVQRCRTQRLFVAGDRVLLGLGADVASLGLLGFLLHAREALGIASVSVAAIEERCDEEADDAEQVADLGRLARQLGLTFHGVRPSGRGGRVRVVDELRTIAASHGYARIALASTRDDDAVRVLAEVLRGRGLSTLRGLAPKVRGGVVRPLLGLERTEAGGLAALLDVDIVMPPPGEAVAPRDRITPALASTVLPRLRGLSPSASASLARLGRDARRVQRSFAREARDLVAGCDAGAAELTLEGAMLRGVRGPWVAREALRALSPGALAEVRSKDAATLVRAARQSSELGRAGAVVLHGATALLDRRDGRVTLRRRGSRG